MSNNQDLTRLTLSSLLYYVVDVHDEGELTRIGRRTSSQYQVSLTGYLRNPIGPIEADTFVSMLIKGDLVTINYGLLKRSDEDDEEKMGEIVKNPPSTYQVQVQNNPPSLKVAPVDNWVED